MNDAYYLCLCIVDLALLPQIFSFFPFENFIFFFIVCFMNHDDDDDEESKLIDCKRREGVRNFSETKQKKIYFRFKLNFFFENFSLTD